MAEQWRPKDYSAWRTPPDPRPYKPTDRYHVAACPVQNGFDEGIVGCLCDYAKRFAHHVNTRWRGKAISTEVEE